ncbi:mco [Symbiodinium sp. CCMP2456]|nr:mco [Symbiodinium sp. CCMP2456]
MAPFVQAWLMPFFASVVAATWKPSTELVQLELPPRGAPLPEVPAFRSSNGVLNCTLRLRPARVVGPNVSFVTRIYNDFIPGPTIMIKPGDRLLITVQNDLQAPLGKAANDVYQLPNTTNLHVHGLHVSPNAPADDVFGTVLGPGDSFMYDYKLIADHSPGTYWAHPHHHGSNVMQAGAGAASVLLVQDPPGFLSAQLETLPDHSLMLQNLPLPLLTAAAKASGDQLFQSSPQEDLWLVNGAVQPVLTVASTQWHRLRLVMAGVSDWLFLDFGSCETALLAKDGIYIDDFPRWISRVSLPPGGRADLVVRCPGSEEGTNHAIASLASPGNGVKSYVGPLFSIRSVESQGSRKEDLAPWHPRSRPTYLQDLSGGLTSPDCSCKTPLGQGVHTRWIDGHLFEGAKKYLHQWPRDAVVQREISGIDKHSFHQHTWPFQLQNTPGGNDPYFKAGDWHDTYQNVLDSKATVRFSTVDFAGPEVVHCHALAHSDQGMIGAEIVAGRGRDACHCDLLGEAQPVDFMADERSQSLLLVAGLLFMAMSLLLVGMLRQVVRSARSLSDAYSTLPDGPESA